MNLKLREVLPSDNEILASIIRDVILEFDAPKQGTVYSDPTTDHLYELFQKERSVLWVAALNDEVVGCCGIYPTDALPKGCVELVKFYIAKKARGLGLGKQLIFASIESAIEMKYTSIYLESLPVFSKAVQLYEQNGFIAIDKPLGNSGHTSCNLWMLKQL